MRTCEAQLGDETAAVREALRTFADLESALINAKGQGRGARRSVREPSRMGESRETSSQRLRLVVEHTDTAHPHVHVAVCRVVPETGKACGRKNDARKLSVWAAKYERSRERVQVPNRIARREAREEYRAVVDGQVVADVPVDEAKTKARAVVPLPPMQRKRGAGRAARTAAERQEWAALFKAQVQSRTPPEHARRERPQLARTHRRRRRRRRRRRQKVLAPLTRLKLWKRTPDATPGRTEATAKPTTPRILGPDLQRLEV